MKTKMIALLIVALLALAYVAFALYNKQPCDELGERMFGDCSMMGDL